MTPLIKQLTAEGRKLFPQKISMFEKVLNMPLQADIRPKLHVH